MMVEFKPFYRKSGKIIWQNCLIQFLVFIPERFAEISLAITIVV